MRPFWYAGLLWLTGILLAGCQSGDLNVGQSVINPGQLNIRSIDSVTVQTATVLKTDSFPTSLDPDILVGQWSDPQTGKLTARSFATLDYPSNGLASQTNLRLDSLVLELNYDFVYGDTTSLFDVNVHRLISPLVGTRPFEQPPLYYNTSSIPFEATPLLKKTVFPKPITSRNRQIRFRIADDLAESFYTKLTNGQLKDITTLASFLPGFAFVSPSTTNTIAGFVAATSGLRLYYHTTDNPVAATLLFPMVQRLYFTQLLNDRTGTSLNALQSRSDIVSSRLTGNTSFVSFGAQLQTRIEFPYLNQFATPDQFAGINKALLVISPVRTSRRDNAPPPTQLELYQTNSLNAALQQIPGDVTGSSPATATYLFNAVAPIFTSSYTFDLTYYLSQILKQKAPNLPLLLTLPAPSQNSTYSLRTLIQRTALGNQQKPDYKLQLKLFITSGNQGL